MIQSGVNCQTCKIFLFFDFFLFSKHNFVPSFLLVALASLGSGCGSGCLCLIFLVVALSSS
nr:MAG TPA: Complement C1q-like protein [Caudoviricetes sp.]